MLNNDFQELVKKYKRYKKIEQKKLLLKAMIPLLAILLAAVWFFFPKYSIQAKTEKTAVSTLKKEQQISIKKTQTVKQTDQNPIPKEKKQTQKEIKKLKEVKKSPKPQIKKRQVKNTQAPFKIKITKKHGSIKELIKKQKELNDYPSTIALAKYFYQKRDFDSAIKWSIQASQKDESKPDPWIIYAKSKKKLGYKEVGIKALKIYLQTYPNDKVQKTLDSL